MLGIRVPTVASIALLAVLGAQPQQAAAQFYPQGGPCSPCGQPIAAISAPIVTGPTVSAPVAMRTASVDCPCVKPVTETVYRDVPVVQYRTVQRPVKRAKMVTVMEEQDVTTYQTVNETRTVDVPSYDYQTVTECRPVTVNQSYWRTSMQPVQKMAPCQYDPRPSFLGELNRLGYSMRQAFVPNYVRRREFVPNVVAYNVPTQRTVAVPTTRQVTYNVARVVPVTKKQQVAVQKVVWEDDVVTAYEPYTTTRRVAVGTQTRYAYVNPFGGSTTAAAPSDASGATAEAPTPAKSASGDAQPSESKGSMRLQSAPTHRPAPIREPIYRPETPSESHDVDRGPVATSPESTTPSIVRVAGWRASRRPINEPETLEGPELAVAQK